MSFCEIVTKQRTSTALKLFPSFYRAAQLLTLSFGHHDMNESIRELHKMRPIAVLHVHKSNTFPTSAQPYCLPEAT